MGVIRFYQRPDPAWKQREREILAERKYEVIHGTTSSTGTFSGVMEILAKKGYDLTKGRQRGKSTLYPHTKDKPAAIVTRLDDNA